MRDLLLILVACVLTIQVYAQTEETIDSTGLPGDNFSLEQALALFQKAENPEAFEKQLNEKDSEVNNLDLNGDGETDYIRVISKKEGDVQVVVLQVPVNETENQDIAVIELEKTGPEEVQLQIIGDEFIFGEEWIVEPAEPGQDEGVEKKRGGPSATSVMAAQFIVNVWTWPCVRFIYGPAYRPWVSPWGWRHYPGWWKPWRPYGWSSWRPVRARHFTPTIRVVHTHRLKTAHKVYKPIRVQSSTVKTRHAGAHSNYKVKRTRTTVTGPRGKSVTRTKTTVKKSRRGG